MGFLTSRTIAPIVTTNDLVHIVITSDVSQGNPSGSSYKATIGQVGLGIGINNYLPLSGGTVSGATEFTSGITANTISTTTANTSTLVINTTPTNDSANNNVLVRNTTTGIIGLKDLTHYNFGFFAQTGDSATVVNTITETSILDGGVGSLIVPENYFSPGDSFHVKIGGIVSANNGNTITIKIKTGSDILGTDTITFTNGVTNKSWEFNCDFTIRTIGGPTVGSIMSNGVFTYNVGSDIYGGGFSSLNSTTFDTTIANTLNFTVTWGTASTGNSIYSSMCVLKKTF
jgi:hypothetical protein